MKYFYTFLFGLLLITGWMFGFQNRSILLYPVALKLDFWRVGVETIPMPLGGLLLISFLVGLGFAIVALILRELHLRKKVFQKNMEIRRLEKEIHRLRPDLVQEGEK